MLGDWAQMLPEQMEGSRRQRSPAKVLVAVKAERVISKAALAWALTHVVHPGDCITLLALFSAEKTGKFVWIASFSSFRSDGRVLPVPVCWFLWYRYSQVENSGTSRSSPETVGAVNRKSCRIGFTRSRRHVLRWLFSSTTTSRWHHIYQITTCRLPYLMNIEHWVKINSLSLSLSNLFCDYKRRSSTTWFWLFKQKQLFYLCSTVV